MTSKLVAVYWNPIIGQKVEVARVDRAKMTHVSVIADRRLQGTSGKTLNFYETEVDRHALKWLCDWAAKYVIGKPIHQQYMRTSAVQSPLADPKQTLPDIIFEDLVKVHAASHEIRIPRDMKGEEFHETIRAYIKAKPLRAGEFHLIFDWLKFSKDDLQKCAVNTIALQKVYGPEPEEYDAILEVAARVGAKAEIERLVAMHQGNKARRERAQAQREAFQAQKEQKKAEEAAEAQERQVYKGQMKNGGYAAAAKKASNGKKGGQ